MPTLKLSDDDMSDDDGIPNVEESVKERGSLSSSETASEEGEWDFGNEGPIL